MTVKEAVANHLPSRLKLSKEQKQRLASLEEIDKIRKINKSLPIQSTIGNNSMLIYK